jgi:hypothetical protein
LAFDNVDLDVKTLNNEKEAHITGLARSHHRFKTQIQHDIFNLVLQHGRHDDVLYIFDSDEFKYHDTQDVFEYGLKSQYAETIEYVLSHSDEPIRKQEFIRDAHESMETVRILSRDMRIDPAAAKHTLFMYSVRLGDLENVKYLVEQRGVDPSVNDNAAIIEASKRNDNVKDNVAGYLIKEPRVNPCVYDFTAIIQAIQYKCLKTLKILLYDHRVIRDLNPSTIEYAARKCKIIRDWISDRNAYERKQDDTNDSDSSIGGGETHVQHRLYTRVNV